MSIYLFDVDETLDCSGGPVTADMLFWLKDEGHIVGLCGNWAKALHCYPNWHRFFSFIGPIATAKPEYLAQISTYAPVQEDYILVGNDYSVGQYNSPDDAPLAAEAGWRFINEIDFANGVR